MKSTLLLIQDASVTGDLESILEKEGFRTLVASTEAEVHSAIAEYGPAIDVVLLDWASPGISPNSLLEWLRSANGLEHIEVVVHSPRLELADVDEVLEGGAFFFLNPPFNPAQLRVIVRAAESSYRLKRRLAQQIVDTEDALRLLDHGSFYFRTRRQAELLAVHLGSACADPLMGIGLLELMLNAVEHGNLAISYDEKSDLMESNQLAAEIERRLSLPEYRDRHGEVRMRRFKRSLRVSIIDQGSGFDYEKYMTMAPERIFDSHGRGVLMASTALKLRYVPPGNRVDATIPLALTTQ